MNLELEENYLWEDPKTEKSLLKRKKKFTLCKFNCNIQNFEE